MQYKETFVIPTCVCTLSDYTDCHRLSLQQYDETQELVIEDDGDLEQAARNREMIERLEANIAAAAAAAAVAPRGRGRGGRRG